MRVLPMDGEYPVLPNLGELPLLHPIGKLNIGSVVSFIRGRDRTEEVSVVGVHVSFYEHHYVSVNHEIREDYVHLCGPLEKCLPDEWGHAIAAIVKTVLDLFAHLTTKMTDDSLDHFLQ